MKVFKIINLRIAFYKKAVYDVKKNRVMRKWKRMEICSRNGSRICFNF